MKSAEIIKALRHCATVDRSGCYECPAGDSALKSEFDCEVLMKAEAADLIERLTAENVVLPNGEASAVETLLKEIEWKDMVIALAQRKQVEAEAERDALIEWIKERHDCLDCKHNDFCEFGDAIVVDCMNCMQEGCPCTGCIDSSRWEWRGLPEAPKEETE